MKISRPLVHRLLLGAIIVAGALAWRHTHSAAGDPDASFGTSGLVVTDLLGSSPDAARALALQPDGKILAAGQANSQGGPLGFAVLRYANDGGLDTSFNSTGSVVWALPGLANAEAHALAVQPAGSWWAGSASTAPATPISRW